MCCSHHVCYHLKIERDLQMISTVLVHEKNEREGIPLYVYISLTVHERFQNTECDSFFFNVFLFVCLFVRSGRVVWGNSETKCLCWECANEKSKNVFSARKLKGYSFVLILDDVRIVKLASPRRIRKQRKEKKSKKKDRKTPEFNQQCNVNEMKWILKVIWWTTISLIFRRFRNEGPLPNKRTFQWLLIFLLFVCARWCCFVLLYFSPSLQHPKNVQSNSAEKTKAKWRRRKKNRQQRNTLCLCVLLPNGQIFFS